MTGWFGPALLGARMDGIEPSPLIAAAYLLSGLLLFCALWWRTRRIGNRFALAGVALAAAAAPYSHDAVNLPEIVGAVVIGGSVGLLLARRCAGAVLPWVVVAGHALVGLAAMATGATLYLNPLAFGLVGKDGAIAPGHGMMLALGMAIGALMTAGALWMAVRRRSAGLAWLGSGGGWATAALGFALGNGAMVVAGGLAGVAGLRLGWRARNIGPTA